MLSAFNGESVFGLRTGFAGFDPRGSPIAARGSPPRPTATSRIKEHP